MSVLDDIRRAHADPLSRIRRPVPMPSLAQQKEADLLERGSEKEARLFPQEAQEAEMRAAAAGAFNQTIGGGRSRLNPELLIDQAEAGIYGGAGRIKDFLGDRLNNNFGTDFETSPDIGYSNASLANQAAGVSQFEADRKAADEAAVGESVGELMADPSLANLGSTLFAAGRAGPGAFAGSANTAFELGAGAALTAAAPPLGAAFLGATIGRKGKKVVDAGKRAVELGQEATAAKKIKAGVTKALTSTAKAASSTSILNMDMVQGQIEEMRRKNPDQEITRARIATQLALNIGPAVMQGKVLKMFIPKVGKPNPSLVKFRNTMGGLTKYTDEKTAISLAKTAMNGLPKVFAAGGAEAVQEFVQTWAQILGNQADIDNPANLLQSVYDVATSDKNLQEAVTGAFIGLGAGGSAKAGLGAPKVALSATADLVKGVGRAGTRQASKLVAKSDVQLLNPEERESVRQEYNARKTVLAQKVKGFDEDLERLDKATSIDDIRNDKTLGPMLAEAQKLSGLSDEDAATPKGFKTVKNELTRLRKADKFVAKREFEASSIGQVGKLLGAKAVSKTKKAAETVVKTVTEADAETVIGTIRDASTATASTVKELSTEAIDEVKGIKSSTALGIVEKGVAASTKATKKLINEAKSLSVEDLRRTAAAVSDNNPRLAAELKKLADKKRKVQINLGQKSDTIFNNENLPGPIKSVVKTGKIGIEGLAGIGKVISSVVAGKIDDSESLSNVKEALKVYKEEVKKNPTLEGVFSATKIAELEERLSKATERLAKKTKPVKEKAKEAAASAVDAVAGAAVNVANAAANAGTETETAQVTNPEVKVSNRATKIFRTIAAMVREGTSDTTKLQAEIDPVIADLKAKGQLTKETATEILNRFPELTVDAVKNVLDKYFPAESDPTVQMDETFDSLVFKPITRDEAIERYNRDHPSCPLK